ncbi:antiviral RADAR system adenosine deaminase RdrB [Massilia niabensis]|uniref:Antiviral RADAR system adenosine deaminase RdrB n=1 Tax=Massilia niabensis TaxID=544910 RepID=A0ABW0L4K1_9BURK
MTELTTGAVFASEHLNRSLHAYLRTAVSPSDDKELSIKCRIALVSDLDRSHPRRFRLNDLDRAVRIWWPDDLFVDGKWPLFDELIHQLMVRNGDFLQYRDDKVQAYARLAAEVEPTLLVGWHFAGWILDSQASPHDVARVVDSQLPFYAPPPRPNKHYAEGHVHLGGIHFDALALLGNLADELSHQFQSEFRPLRELTTTLLTADLQAPPAGTLDPESFRSRCIRALSDNELQAKMDDIDWSLLLDRHRLEAEVGGPWLKAQIARAMLAGDQSRAWRWLVVFLWYSYRHADCNEYVRVAVFYLFGKLMQLRHQLIMDGQGLTRFTQLYYNNQLRKTVDVDASTMDVVARMFAGKQDLAEIKISPDLFSAGLTATLAKAVARHSGVASPEFGMAPSPVTVKSYIEQLERWHFCVHFLRREKYVRSRAALWEDANKFAEALARESGWNLDEFAGGHINPDYRFNPGRWLRGLDIAGDENLVRSEVFAPVLRWLRHGLLPRPPDEHGSAGFHLSIHAGEDYAHPLSGLRHVDETVRFCELRSGDRIGHGLALGIEPITWVEHHGDMILSVDEHLDNLVWAWHQACTLSARLPLAAQIVPRLERRISRFLRESSWYDGQFSRSTPQQLYEAWDLRRNCHYQFSSNPVRMYDPQLEAAVPDYDRLMAGRDGTKGSAERIYLHCQEKAHQEKSIKNVLVRQPSGDVDAMDGLPKKTGDVLLHDFETAEDLEFMCALQDFLLNRYDAMGLIIEANPTSNVYIARLENHSQHPIFRWYPPNETCLVQGMQWNRFGLRRGPIKVLINTDDPGIMPTTLRTEYALLGEAAIDLGYSRTCVESWLERLREFGLDEFNRNHLPIFEKKTHFE